MGEPVRLASHWDGFEFGAYLAKPTDARRGGLVLIQEIFGVNEHIRGLADGFADDGYETLAPSFFDRLAPDFVAGYDPAGMAAGREYAEATSWDQTTGDIAATIAALGGPVFAAGYCWGGSAAWLAACRSEGLSAVSSYYGRRIPELVGEAPRCPIILHFGREDASIPPQTVEVIAAAHPDVPVYLYDAAHGFACESRADYRPDAARLARLRTLQLFAMNGGGRGDI